MTVFLRQRGTYDSKKLLSFIHCNGSWKFNTNTTNCEKVITELERSEMPTTVLTTRERRQRM